MNFLLFGLGLAALIVGAELLVRGASRLALAFGISPLVIGLTVVAFGTSSPELAVSVGSALRGQADIAIGNVVGSNIFNVLFILGISALVAPLLVSRQVIRQEVPVMIGVSLLCWGLAADGQIGRGEAGLLLALLIGYSSFLVIQSRREQLACAGRSQAPGGPSPSGWKGHWAVQVGMIVMGLALLVLGARWLVAAAIAFATDLGVSELVIGLTIIAAGTSLPEVATSVLAALKGERDIAVGNVVGSNSLNILGVLGASGTLAPEGLPVSPAVLGFDLPVMAAVAFACLPIFYIEHRIARWEGGLFLAYYAAYMTYVVLNAQHHDALEPFGAIMATFVVPLTAVTLAVLVFRRVRKRRPD